jgi:hypothetical protein
MAVFSPFRNQEPDSVHAIDRGGAELIAAAVFTSLEEGGYLNPGPPVDRQIRIILAITEAIGHVREPPGGYSPGRWMRRLRIFGQQDKLKADRSKGT